MAIYADKVDTIGCSTCVDSVPSEHCYPPIVIRKPDNSAFRYFKLMNGADKEMRRNNRGLTNGC